MLWAGIGVPSFAWHGLSYADSRALRADPAHLELISTYIQQPFAKAA
jgi:hypothetical protein